VTDYYAVLGVGRDATSEEIKRAYRKLARQYHPDVNGGDAAAEERIKEVNRAYSVLSDPDKKRRYDTLGEAGLDGQGGPNMADPFGFGFGTFDDVVREFFGGGDPFVGRGRRRSRSRRGEDIEERLSLEFTEAVFGTSRDLEYVAAVACPRCHASGAEPGTEPTVCRNCHGSGQQRTVRQSLLGQLVTTTTCAVCSGSGQEVLTPCVKCRGQGRVADKVSLTIEIPPGVEGGMQIRYHGRGHAGEFGGPPGDLYVRLVVAPHKVFERDGDNLLCRMPVPMTVAALGGTVTLVTLDGEEVVEVEPGTQPGTVKRFRKRGVPHTDGRGRGDLLVELAVQTPDDLSEEERRLLRQLAELRGEAVNPQPAGFFARIKGSGR
jgi:molecular chaperone DnaJ